MQTKTLALQLNSPAFLGDASQSGVWRTPPIKALLREWWRIASAQGFSYNVQAMREAEGLLFGNAWLDDRFCKSQVRIALEHWHEGKMRQHTALAKIPHPEAEKAGKMVEPLNYLGYGPIDRGQFKNGAALQAGETNSLDLAYREADQAAINQTLYLIDWFGTFGGRSRNAWGSLALGLDTLTADHPQLKTVLRDLKQCLSLDWPHAIGQDTKGTLIWESKETFADWKAAMTFLARTKIEFRTQLKFVGGQPHQQPQERHLLAYPVTNHKVNVRGWGGDGRIANQLRFKLFRDAAGQLRARLYHTPHRCPLPTGMSEAQELAVWQKIHTWLDQQSSLQRLGAVK
jgi:CRISPR-associated protein Cmr1